MELSFAATIIFEGREKEENGVENRKRKIKPRTKKRFL